MRLEVAQLIATRIVDNLEYMGALQNGDVAGLLRSRIAALFDQSLNNGELLTLLDGVLDVRQVADNCGTTDWE